MPWAAPDAKCFTALLEAQVLLMAMSSMPVSGIARALREHDTRMWAILRRAVSAAHAGADFSGVGAVGVDETARRRGRNCLTSFVDLDGGRVMLCERGRDASTAAAFAEGLRAHGEREF